MALVEWLSAAFMVCFPFSAWFKSLPGAMSKVAPFPANHLLASLARGHRLTNPAGDQLTHFLRAKRWPLSSKVPRPRSISQHLPDCSFDRRRFGLQVE
jgi:hypothetical protein